MREEKKQKKEKDAEEKKKKEEEEKRREDEENAIESDHHGRNYIDYEQPRQKYISQVYDFSSQIKIAHGTFSIVYMCTIAKTGK